MAVLGPPAASRKNARRRHCTYSSQLAPPTQHRLSAEKFDTSLMYVSQGATISQMSCLSRHGTRTRVAHPAAHAAQMTMKHDSEEHTALTDARS